MDIQDIIQKLDQEPLTHLMLGHRELFHSNLLKWFFDYLPENSWPVFKSFSQPQPFDDNIKARCAREEDQIDLKFEWPDYRPLWIENKVFSLPNAKQLSAYRGKANETGKNACLRLLSLSDPGCTLGLRNCEGWTWVPYAELAKRIRSSLPRSYSYEVEMMRRYANMVQLLSELAAFVVVKDPGETVSQIYQDTRLMPSMTKLRAYSVAQHIEIALSNAGFKQEQIKVDMSHGEALNDWFASIPGHADLQMGWQLQGAQFRLGIRGADKSLELAKEEPRFFDFALLDELLGTKEEEIQPKRKPHGQFKASKGGPKFLYRYKKAPRLTVKQLGAAAVIVARSVEAYGSRA